MARIVLTCWGSHGDIDPFLGLGLALGRRGHRVAIAAPEFYRALIEGAGLAFHPLRPDIDPTDTSLVHRIMDRRRGSEFLLREILFAQIEAMFEDVSAAASQADLLVSHPVTFATPIVAERRGLPWASAVLAPTSMFSTYDIPAVPPAPWVKSLERLGRWPGKLVVAVARRETGKWAKPLYEFRERLGLGEGGNPVMEGQHSPHLVLALYSRLLGDRQPDWPPHTVITGHVFHDAPHGAVLPPNLDAFLSDGPPPVVFTLGSSVVLIANDFWLQSVDAARRTGARAVLLVGAGRSTELDAAVGGHQSGRDVIVVDRAPHSLLFPRASIVVQQCGIGTMAQGLRSGRPMLAVPYSHDQPDNAWRAKRLGVARILYPSRYRAARVARELGKLLSDATYASSATKVAAEIGNEGGAEAACDAIEQTFFNRTAQFR
jgi:rhamnosyltransferase subunit B